MRARAEEDTIDKAAIRRMLVSYVTRRHDVHILSVVSKVLAFSEEEKRQVGLRKKKGGGLMAAFWGGGDAAAAHVHANSTGSAPSNFNDFWEEFLTTSVERPVMLPDGVVSSSPPRTARGALPDAVPRASATPPATPPPSRKLTGRSIVDGLSG